MIKTLSLIIALSFALMSFWVMQEPELIKAATTDTVVVTQQVTTGLAISDCANFELSQVLSGIGPSGPSTGACTWNVKTANSSGFSMTLKASSDPALCTVAADDTCSTGKKFSDYTEAQSGTPDYSFSIAATDAEFGYTVEPASAGDTVQKFLDNGSACGVGSLNGTETCWLDFSTSAYTVINRSSETGNAGHNEIVRFQVQIGSSAVQAAGTYTAGITATVTDN